MSYPPTPPLLLTQRLSSFLHSSLLTLQQQQQQQSVPILHTALLITPSGKLLAYESQTPMRTLRTQCSVAASLWAIHASSSSSVGTALGQQHSQQQQSPPLAAATSPSSLHQQNFPQHYAQHQHLGDADIDHQQQQQQRNDDGSVPTSIAASFHGGAVFVVRRLRCGLLFACATAPSSKQSRPSTANGASLDRPEIDISGLGISDPDAPATATSTATPSSLLPQPIPLEAAAASSLQPLQLPALPTPIIRPPASTDTGLVAAASVLTTGTAESYTTAEAGNGGSSHDRDGGDGGDHDAASMMTTATVTTTGGGARQHSSVAATMTIARRQVEQLALLLDEKLGTLSVPEENIGVNGFR